MGFEYVEIPIEDPGLIEGTTVKKALDDHALKPIVCGAFGPSRDLTSEDPSLHHNCFEYLNKCFDLSLKLGADFVAGPMYSAVGKARLLPPAERQKEWNMAVENLRKVAEAAEANGLKLAIEALNRFETDLVNTTEDLVKLIRDIDHPAARVLLDSFHMTIEERSLIEAIRTAGDLLIHVQVSENYRGAPGTGQTRWDEIKTGLEEVGYDGVVSIESFTPEVKELAGAVCIWKPFSASQDQFAKDGIRFLKELFES